MNRHVQFQTSYVLSWSRAWGGSPVAAYKGSPQAVNPAQQFESNEWGPTNNDERHRFVFSGVFGLPLGIQLAPMFQAASARPYSWLAGSDVDGDGRVIIDRVCVGSSAANFVTTPGCQMLPPNSLRGTPFVELDLGTSKKFQLGERASLKFSVNLFNVLNRANYCNDYVETDGPNALAKPQGYCGGPITPAGQSGYSAAAVPSFRTQFGLRFDF
jgi:hypothetical protein